jgi:pimeloyl-ACP methyl ester carboxylesterase
VSKSTFLSEQGAYVQINGLCMYYETQGVGTPVILLHGGLETCQMWAPVIPSFSMHYQVITPDSRAHGRTDNPSGKFSYPLMAEDIALFIQALELQRPFVVGYSDGGQTALQMAITYPGLARGYLIGAVYNSITTEWRQMMQLLLGFEGSGLVDIERVIQTNPEFVRSLEAKHDPFHESGYWKSLLTQVSQAWWEPPMYTQADFAKITDPTLFWCGDRDVFCPPEQSLEMYRMVNTAELAIVPNADHFTMAEQFDIAAMILLNFMARLSEPN